MMLSVGHHITFNQAKLNSVLEKVGLENFVLETDADFYIQAHMIQT